ncbi:hypothetical protein [Sorangium cellulosum]|uniref:Uncharacterized protein n=2 Tax=Sorangium cellulosum TaxID=56 RepID=A0A150TNG7_SORCE|nr:hypothetical protein [Sorangium cellulosum]AGP35112.1 hypothetical protein SCE1572_11680 [Sorangium cellulosum So0157-2]KYG06263.1 hypothetical protein BE21_35830 [Sorangium cellulosum]
MAADWLIELLAAAGGVGGVVVATRRLLARRHYRASDVTLVCPRTGTPVRCQMIADGRSGEFVEVARCSRLPGGQPACDQDCVKLLNLGIRLSPVDPARSGPSPVDPARSGERAAAGDPGDPPGPPAP